MTNYDTGIFITITLLFLILGLIFQNIHGKYSVNLKAITILLFALSIASLVTVIILVILKAIKE